MNNSDIIAALALFLTGAIFLAQTDGDILKLKFKKAELIGGVVLLVCIVIFVNSAAYERWGIQPYFSIGHFYLTPAEWALIIFLFLFGFIITRVFSNRIYRAEPKIILKLLNKYKSENQYAKCWNLIEQIFYIEHNKEILTELGWQIFNDDLFVQKTASERPYLLLEYSRRNEFSRISSGADIYDVLFGLFSSTNNPIYSEIEAFRTDEAVGSILSELFYIEKGDLIAYGVLKHFPSESPILKWFVDMLDYMPYSLREDIQHFFRFIDKQPDDLFNTSTYSRDEVEIVLKRDAIFNAIKLFRIGLVYHLYISEKRDELIDRILLIFYCAWDFILSRTKLKNENVALNNDSFTINEYLLKYQFESYIVLMMVQSKIAEDVSGHEIHEWPIKQLFAKLNGLLGSDDHVSMRSKQYYIEAIFDFFFETEKYCDTDETTEFFRNAILIFINSSLDRSPYGDHILIIGAYSEAFRYYDFVPFQNDRQLVRRFYSELLPFTADFEYYITGTVS